MIESWFYFKLNPTTLNYKLFAAVAIHTLSSTNLQKKNFGLYCSNVVCVCVRICARAIARATLSVGILSLTLYIVVCFTINKAARFLFPFDLARILSFLSNFVPFVASLCLLYSKQQGLLKTIGDTWLTLKLLLCGLSLSRYLQ